MALNSNKCRDIAIRYQFKLDISKNGEPHIEFIPHTVISLPVDNVVVENKKNEQLNAEDIEYNDDVEYLRSLDPKEWKLQDHYKVLGIEKYRFTANEQIIKTAFHKKLLKHHPDKRKALGEEIKPDDDYFTNITMAYETLKTIQGRRAYDSVDPIFDNSLPSASSLKQQNFFNLFSYYFKINSRWSDTVKSPPQLGTMNSTREHVDDFYSFWYNFKSWREYSYEDEEDKEKCQDRDERRYVDKLNKAERQRKKKEEMSRIRTLVDLAYNNDPRIAKFKQDDKDRKLAAKRAKQTMAQQRKDEEEERRKVAQLAKEQAEAAERARIDAIRQQREQQKKALKRERKKLRDTCKANNYYIDNNNSNKNLEYITQVESICENYTIDELIELNDNIQNNGKTALLKAFNDINKKKDAERQEAILQESTKNKSIKDTNCNGILKVNPEWNEENLRCLVKAVNLFPSCTNQRWEVIANFINQHGVFRIENNRFTAKLVLAKAKALQNPKNNLKDQITNNNSSTCSSSSSSSTPDNVIENSKNTINKSNVNNVTKKQPQSPLPKTPNPSISTPKTPASSTITTTTTTNTTTTTSIKTASSSNTNTINTKTNQESMNSTEQQKNDKKTELQGWTSNEQQLLEQALKTYPQSTPERWDRIAECIPTRSKKECIKRYKDLVETVKAKKAAQNLGNSKTPTK